MDHWCSIQYQTNESCIDTTKNNITRLRKPILKKKLFWKNYFSNISWHQYSFINRSQKFPYNETSTLAIITLYKVSRSCRCQDHLCTDMNKYISTNVCLLNEVFTSVVKGLSANRTVNLDEKTSLTNFFFSFLNKSIGIDIQCNRECFQ